MPADIELAREIVYAHECSECEICGDLVCPVCDEHYADCPCPGPHSEREVDE